MLALQIGYPSRNDAKIVHVNLEGLKRSRNEELKRGELKALPIQLGGHIPLYGGLD